jgi:hypothetical protein
VQANQEQDEEKVAEKKVRVTAFDHQYHHLINYLSFSLFLDSS